MTESLEQLGLPEDELNAVLALADVVQRTGAKELEFGHKENDSTRWYATAKFGGTRVIVDDQRGAGETADELAIRLLHNGRCSSCKKIVAAQDGRPLALSVMVLGGGREERSADDMTRNRLCWWERQGRVWVRECGPAAPEGSTRERLAQALIEAGYVHAAMIAAARAARYDDYLAETPFPQMLLVQDLQQYGRQAQGLIERVKAGDFDATREEADAWAASEEGREAYAELLGGGGRKAPRPRPAPSPGGKDPGRARAEAARRRRGKHRR